MSYTVTNAGDTNYNGTYSQSGTYNGQPKYTNGSKWLFYAAYSFPEPGNIWAFDVGATDYMDYIMAVYYGGASITGTYYTGMAGTAPAPAVEEAATNVTVTPAALSLTTSLKAPTIDISKIVTPNAFSLTATLNAPETDIPRSHYIEYNTTDKALNTVAKNTKVQSAKQTVIEQFVDLDMKTKKILNVADPTSDQEAATKKYVDDNAGVGAHNDLSEIQGGTTNEYYHLTSAQHTDLTDEGATELHTHEYANLTELPTLFSGSYTDLTDKPTIPDAYTLPTASTTVLGGIKIGEGLAITDGVVNTSLTAAAVKTALGAASTTADGYLTTADWDTFNDKQAAITTGTASQYFKGDLSLGTFPTALSDFTADIDTDDVSEGSTNKYYTDARVKTKVQNDESYTIAGDWTFQGATVVPTPTAGGHAVTKDYADSLASASGWQMPVLSLGDNTPPGSPTTGDRYVLGGSPTGAWSGHAKDIAEYDTDHWDFTDAASGYATYVIDVELAYLFNGTNWVTFGGGVSDHASLTNRDYASAGHTGFEPTVTKGNLTGTTNRITVTGGTGAVIGSGTSLTLPQDIHTAANPTFAALTVSSVNKVVITAPATSATLTIANGKTLTASNTLTLAGTDSTVMTFPGANGTVLTADSTATVTNKRNTARVTTITSNALPTVNTDVTDCVTITALAAAITSMSTNLSGTPVNFDKLLYRIKDDGTARAITWGPSFTAGTRTLPTSTTAGKYLYVGFVYDSVTSLWECQLNKTEL